jgi:hypothetical protein
MLSDEKRMPITVTDTMRRFAKNACITNISMAAAGSMNV